MRRLPSLQRLDEQSCVWCDKCITVCPYDAITNKNFEGKKVAEIVDLKCKGCGICLPVCPENSIDLLTFSDNEIESMIDAMLV